MLSLKNLKNLNPKWTFKFQKNKVNQDYLKFKDLFFF